MTKVDLSQLAIDRTPTENNRVGRRNLITRYLLPGLLVLGFLSLIFWASRDWIFPPHKVTVVPIRVTTAVTQTEGAELFNAAGWIEPRPSDIRVAALAGGVVEKLLVVEDQKVTAGEPIARLVSEDAQLSLDRCIADQRLAEAELKSARAALVAARVRFDQPVHLQAQLAEAEAGLAEINTMLQDLPFQTERAESTLSFAKRDYQRNLGAAKSLSQREIDQSLTDLETARASLKELENRQESLTNQQSAIEQRREALNLQLQLLVDEIESRDRAEGEVLAGEARVEQMKVDQEKAQLQLDRMTVRAPVDGRIYRLVGLPGSQVGERVMMSMDKHDGGTVVTMYRPDHLQIRVDVRFEDIPKVSLGQKLVIDNPALAEPIFGSVLFISSEADIQKNTLQVKVKIDEPPEFFKPEMLVDVTFLAPKPKMMSHGSDTTSHEQLKIFIDPRWVKDFDGKSTVWVADQSAGVARRKTVRVGQTAADGTVEITEGLNISSRLIVSGSEGLKDGARIEVTQEPNLTPRPQSEPNRGNAANHSLGMNH